MNIKELMEKQFSIHGGSNSGIQIMLREFILNKMIAKYGEKQTMEWLTNDFDKYKRISDKIL